MKIFAWQGDAKYIIDDEGQLLLTQKPDLGFDYESIMYTDNMNRKNINEILSDSEKQSIDTFIGEFKKTNTKAFCVDNNGNYLGYVNYVEGINNKIPYAPADSSYIWSFGKKMWQKKYFYNSVGYQVSAEYSIGFTVNPPPSAEHVYSVDTESWILNDTATCYRKFLTKIKTLGALFYYMDYVYGNQEFLIDIVNNIKQKAAVDGKTDLQLLCIRVIEILNNCNTATDKKQLNDELDQALSSINSKVMLDINDPVFIQTNVWNSIDKL